MGRLISSHVDLPIMWAWQLSMCWRMAGIPVRVELASEFRYRSLSLEPDSLYDGQPVRETADSSAALRRQKARGKDALV